MTSTLRTHILIHSNPLNNKSSLQTPVSIHGSTKPFQCKICNSKRSDRSYLQKHLHDHSDEKSLERSICKNNKQVTRSKITYTDPQWREAFSM